MMTEREKNLETLEMLKYQAGRYQATGNGAMCQQLAGKIRKLIVELNTMPAKAV